MPVIEVAGVQKEFKRLRRPPQRAVDSLDMVVEEGGVHGFLGPNGSGKTTTIRMLLGLVAADAGRITLLGKPVPEGLPEVIGQVGALVETPLFFPQFSGRLNLELLATVAELPKGRVEEALETVGLTSRADDRVKTYSLGMKQRLGVAAALLKRPRLLILDEPGNGLDPAGMREMRELVKALGKGGVTVFLSSHLLHEVEQVCDRVDIIARGRSVASGSVRDVIAGVRTGAADVRVRVSDLLRATQALAGAGITVRAETDHLVVSGVEDPASITETLAEQRLYVSELTPLTDSLETAYFDITGEPR